jgi:hemoglobin
MIMKGPLNDIETREDIERLINAFYEKVRKDPTIGYIFNDIAKVNWEEHLPVMYSFWSSMLLGERSYEGNVMQKHIELSNRVPFTDQEFSAWLKLFKSTIDELFSGTKSDEAKSRAESIAGMMLIKIERSFS